MNTSLQILKALTKLRSLPTDDPRYCLRYAKIEDRGETCRIEATNGHYAIRADVRQGDDEIFPERAQRNGVSTALVSLDAVRQLAKGKASRRSPSIAERVTIGERDGALGATWTDLEQTIETAAETETETGQKFPDIDRVIEDRPVKVHVSVTYLREIAAALETAGAETVTIELDPSDLEVDGYPCVPSKPINLRAETDDASIVVPLMPKHK